MVPVPAVYLRNSGVNFPFGIIRNCVYGLGSLYSICLLKSESRYIPNAPLEHLTNVAIDEHDSSYFIS